MNRCGRLFRSGADNSVREAAQTCIAQKRIVSQRLIPLPAPGSMKHQTPPIQIHSGNLVSSTQGQPSAAVHSITIEILVTSRRYRL